MQIEKEQEAVQLNFTDELLSQAVDERVPATTKITVLNSLHEWADLIINSEKKQNDNRDVEKRN